MKGHAPKCQKPIEVKPVCRMWFCRSRILKQISTSNSFALTLSLIYSKAEVLTPIEFTISHF